MGGWSTRCELAKRMFADREGWRNSAADTVILLWMAGGMAHTETFDPKRYTAFEKGMEGNSVLSTFKSFPTVLDGISFSEGLEVHWKRYGQRAR